MSFLYSLSKTVSAITRHHTLCACSNRSAALLKLNKMAKALADAEECIKSRQDWEKGYFRKGNVLEALQRYEEVKTG